MQQSEIFELSEVEETQGGSAKFGSTNLNQSTTLQSYIVAKNIFKFDFLIWVIPKH